MVKSEAKTKQNKTKQNKKVKPCCFCEKSVLVSPSPQDPAKRAEFRVALLGGGARPRERAAEIGPAEAGERDPRRESAGNEGRGPEIEGERIPV